MKGGEAGNREEKGAAQIEAFQFSALKYESASGSPQRSLNKTFKTESRVYAAAHRAGGRTVLFSLQFFCCKWNSFSAKVNHFPDMQRGFGLFWICAII